MPNRSLLSIAIVVVIAASGCRQEDVGEARSGSSRPAEAPAAVEMETGEATYYADLLDRQRTASGELLDQGALVAAHRRFPFGTVLRVTNLENGRAVEVRVIDRGPFGAPRAGVERVIDLSRRAAEQLRFVERGSTPVRVEVLAYGEGLADPSS